jgi:GTP-binding protein
MHMPLVNFGAAKFSVSAPSFQHCPDDNGAEIAFVGRSNSGKSSAINTLTGIKGLARTSKTPGRTQHINFFTIEPHKKLVDLPGYGFAKVSKAQKKKWDQHLTEYLECRNCLVGLVLLMDIRHVLLNYDRQMLIWAKSVSLPVHILLTKSDKLSRMRCKEILINTQQQARIIDADSSLFSSQVFSAKKKIGIDQLRQTLNLWFT